jgi:hypothetical protein
LLHNFRAPPQVAGHEIFQGQLGKKRGHRLGLGLLEGRCLYNRHPEPQYADIFSQKTGAHISSLDGNESGAKLIPVIARIFVIAMQLA